MKIQKKHKIVIGSSVVAGLVTLIPTLYLHLPLIYLLGAMLTTTIIANWYLKLTCESYYLQYRLENNRLILSIIGLRDSDLTIVRLCVKSFDCFIDCVRLEQNLLKKNITLDDYNMICINGELLSERKYVAIHRQMLFYLDLIAESIEYCLISPTQSIQEPKRKSILFWR